MRNPQDKIVTEQLFTWLCDELNKSYNWFMDLYELDSKLSFGLPPKDQDICETIPK
jgi:hypothetical protein